MNKFSLITIIFSLLLSACNQETTSGESTENARQTETTQGHSKNSHENAEAPGTTHYEQEKHLSEVKQLTFGGDNAEAYFSFDNSKLVMQITNPKWEVACDQIFYMPTSGYTGERPPMVSTGKGRTTCSFFMPGDSTVIYASTHLGNENCPETPRSVDGKYVWPVYADFDIFVADLDGNIIKQYTDSPGYDAEPTVSPDGKTIVFTSTRSGDLELYTMDIDGNNVKQVTNELGYDGGAFFSPDSKKLLFRASRPKTKEEIETYQSLLAKNVVQPSDMEIFVCNVDGSDMKQITDLGGANWAPYFHPSGEKIVFSSNHHSRAGGRPQFNIFAINLDGTGLERITFDSVFDAFPMFSYDGKKLVFSSNRNNGGTRDTNVFIADWVE